MNVPCAAHPDRRAHESCRYCAKAACRLCEVRMRGQIYCSTRCARDGARHPVWRRLREPLSRPVSAWLAVAAVAVGSAGPLVLALRTVHELDRLHEPGPFPTLRRPSESVHLDEIVETPDGTKLSGRAAPGSAVFLYAEDRPVASAFAEGGRFEFDGVREKPPFRVRSMAVAARPQDAATRPSLESSPSAAAVPSSDASAAPTREPSDPPPPVAAASLAIRSADRLGPSPVLPRSSLVPRPSPVPLSAATAPLHGTQSAARLRSAAPLVTQPASPVVVAAARPRPAPVPPAPAPTRLSIGFSSAVSGPAPPSRISPAAPVPPPVSASPPGSASAPVASSASASGSLPPSNASGSGLFPPDLTRGPADRREILVSFDGGSSDRGAAQILDALAARGIRTTVFLTGEFIRRYPALVRRIAADGHEVGNHTDTHPHLTTFAADGRQVTKAGVDRAFLSGELARTSRLYRETTGREMAPLWRAPFGEHNTQIRRWAAEQGYWHVGWTGGRGGLDGLDWISDPGARGYQSAETLLRRLVRRAENGGVVLLHLGSDRTEPVAQRIDLLLDGLRGRQFDFAKASDFLSREGWDAERLASFRQPGAAP